MNSSHAPSQQYTDLDTFLEHLRLRGIPVGTLELHRLHTIFQKTPQLSHNEMAELLCTILAKDDQQRKTILRLFDQLIPQDTEDENSHAGAIGARASGSKQNLVPIAPAWERNTAEEEAEAPEEPTKKPLNIIAIGLITLAIITSLILLFAKNEIKDDGHTIIQTAKPTSNPTKEIPIEAEEEKSDPLNLIKTIDLWIPSIVEVTAIPLRSKLLPPLSLFLGAGFGFIWLLHKARPFIRQRKPKRLNISNKRGRSFIPPIKDPVDYYLLNSNSRREMSWGISNYISEQLQHKLDIPKSVAATASSGLPSICYQQASQQREVWLWIDQGSENPDLNRLADEITQTLQAVNISVQRGYFYGLPNKIINEQGEVLWSVSHKYPENQALVAIFMDSDSLLQTSRNKDSQHNCLNLLSQWQLLAMVDCSIHKGGLKSITEPYQLKYLLPKEVSYWLARQDWQPQTETEFKQTCELQQWAMACALPDRPITEAETRALHEALGLDCAWQYHSLKHYANQSSGGLDFAQQRFSLLQAFANLAQNPAYKDFTQQTIQFWLQRTQNIDQQRQQQETPDRPWKNSQRQFQLKLEVALLELWLEDTDKQQGIIHATKTLHDLHNNKKLQKRVKQNLAQYICVNYQTAVQDDEESTQEGICLPHNWQELPAITKQQLLNSGFGGETDDTVKLQWDNTTFALLTSLAGLSLLGLFTGLYALMLQEPVIQVLANSPEPINKIQTIEQGRIQLGTHKLGLIDPTITDKNGDEHKIVDNNHIVKVKWQRHVLTPAQILLDDDGYSELWRLGTPEKTLNNIHEKDLLHSIAIIAESAKELSARRLAAVLLDAGTADQVLISKSWKHYLKKLQEKGGYLEYLAHTKQSQWLYIGENLTEDDIDKSGGYIAYIKLKSSQLAAMGTPSLAQQAEAIKQTGESQSSTVLVSVAALNGKVIDNKKEPKIIGIQLAKAKSKQQKIVKKKIIELSQGMKLIPIPQGDFEMGSNAGGSYEKPVHKVTLNYDFYMSQTEITFAQYDAYLETKAGQNTIQQTPSDNKPDDRPVINVSWNNAQAYVNWLTEKNEYGLTCRLPSEAEWEYSARAGTTTTYPWGNEIGKNKANCDSCGSEWDGEKTAPVKSFKANQYGLHDMHGNVWEWVQDCYHDTYQNSPSDGSVWEDKECGDRRVLRGGSWGNSPDDLRSAGRYSGLPDGQFNLIGFRVVCLPPSAAN